MKLEKALQRIWRLCGLGSAMADNPSVIAHCDWGASPKKRWMAVAVRNGSKWTAFAPEPVGDTATLLDRLQKRANGPGAIFVGFDFPIGLPSAYGALTGFPDFHAALKGLGKGDWSRWFEAAENPQEISIHRPFYPHRAGPKGTVKKQHLYDGLGFDSPEQLLRLCERATPETPLACMLFWTIGGNQVGKAAISGWLELIIPNLDRIRLWPFDGSLDKLLPTSSIVVAETYPAAVYRQLGLRFRAGESKRDQLVRQSFSAKLQRWISDRSISAKEDLVTAIEDGFGSRGDGEDQFDAVIGLFGMLDVARGYRGDAVPDQPAIKQWEGWMLGQSCPTAHERLD